MIASKKMEHALQFMPQLDGLRALAALGVFAQHFLSKENLLSSKVPFGDLGVRLFFVLSGFLITRIILNGRESIDQKILTRKSFIGNFFIRRFLRLIPVYFIFLTVSFWFIPNIRQYALWFYFYLQNFHYAIRGNFSFANPMWTLAVEEQFYLIWPFIILFLPRRWLLSGIVTIAFSGMLFRLIFLSLGMGHFSASMLTPSHLDTLGIGGVLAILFPLKEQKPLLFKRILLLTFLIGISILFIVFVAKIMGLPSTVEFVLGEVGSGLFFMWVIGNAALSFNGFLGQILSHSCLTFLGKISYGMYVYHWFVPNITKHTLAKLDILLPQSEWLLCVLFSAISISAAAFSWHFIEAPILKLKKHFSYCPLS